MSVSGAQVLPSEPGRTDAQTRVITVVSIAHGVSHFSHLLIPPLFPWLRDAFALSNTELGLLLTVFFVVSGAGQAVSGFLVDRVGAVPVMIGSLATITLGCLVLAASPGYWALVAGAALIGMGNSPFHPVDYSIMNARIAATRLGQAYAVHGVAGSLGWALAPALMVGIARIADWRMAFVGAAVVAALSLALVVANRAPLATPPAHAARGTSGTRRDTFDFLRLPAVWLSFLFFLVWALALGGVQSFGAESARLLHGVPVDVAALCLSAYMVANAAGMLMGGRLVRDPTRADRVVGAGFLVAAAFSLVLALVAMPASVVPLLFAAIGLGTGVCGPSRDLLVRAAAPPGATGRVYGMVYSGLDVGMAIGPPVFGVLMDRGWPAGVWIAIAALQVLLVGSVVRLGRSVRHRASPVRAAA